ncbi:MAG: beta galactosidase jelly roll domain-containing protein [Acidobacteriaceae bacterium]|nr:beta galactosidase jelly roll domain-containing protein [Acidobacteriaceae bacterium]
METPLREGWTLQSACKVQADGATISKSTFHPEGWIAVTVPSTVLAAQVASGEFKEPYFGMNLRNIPGTSYPIGQNFSNLPMSEDSPYHCGWWYRRTFTVPAADRDKTLWLRFGGINYRANLWLNGKQIADDKQIAGAYRTYEFDITRDLAPDKENTIAIETFAPTETDLGINWVDWNPCPPDKDMGLWGPVDLVTTGPVSLRSPLAITHFTDSSLSKAELSVYAELHNASDHPVHGNVTGTVAGIRIEQPVELAANESKTVVFSPEQFQQLRIHDPRVWWPYQMGEPHLETLTLTFNENGRVSDEQSVRFGIREITSELTDKGFRLFRVNGKPILIRGAGWSQDMLLRENPEKLRDQFRLVRDMHLNTIRLEGKMETQDFFNLADEQGILVMLGWCCCDHWEHWDKWQPGTLEIATASLRSQILRLRSHASLLVWLNGSDNPPPANVESAYLAVESETHWPNPTLSSASAAPTTVTGKSGVKMTGPYDYVAPSYWLVDTGKYGGAYGFNTETSPGPAIPTLSSLKKFIPADQLWPPNATWSYHFGGGEFKDLNVFDEAMKAAYGTPESLTDYIRIAQTMSYDTERAMFEGYSRNKYTSTGVIQWMLNNAWPSMIWHLYDYYLDSGGGYFGAKKACEPLHAQYSYDDHSVYVVNSTYQVSPKLTLSARAYDNNLKELFAKSSELETAADSSINALSIPDSAFDSAPITFIELTLKDPAGKIVSHNFYWVPSKLTTWNWPKTDYTHTPALEHEDLKALLTLPQAHIEATAEAASANTFEVHLHNPSKALAFQVAVTARKSDGEDIVPTLWSDNYVELMPDESVTLRATLPAHAPERYDVVVSGWNVPSITLHPAAGAHTLASISQ